MPIHDWGRVKAGIFHDFHHALVEQIKRDLNSGILPAGYYAMAEQIDGGLGPEQTRIVAETDQESYRRKQSLVAVRHVSDHRVVAVAEVVSPGNKSTRQALEQFTRKTAEFLEQGVHLLVIDLLPPGRFDPNGIHGAIWDDLAAEDDEAPVDKPLTAVSYESDLITRAYVEPIAVGDALPDMPLFLEPADWVSVPLERSYRTTWETLPSPLQELIQASA
jgi:hypothetical protein